jgi:hypothetical protein
MLGFKTLSPDFQLCQAIEPPSQPALLHGIPPAASSCGLWGFERGTGFCVKHTEKALKSMAWNTLNQVNLSSK